MTFAARQRVTHRFAGCLKAAWQHAQEVGSRRVFTGTANLLLAVGISACFSPGDSLTDEMPEDFPEGSCQDTDADACASSSGTTVTEASTTGEGSSTAAVSDDCESTQACLGEDVCVAEWDAEAGSRDPFSCRFACVPLLDESAWCSDDAACCDAAAQCTERGYCLLLQSDDDGGDGTTAEGSTG